MKLIKRTLFYVVLNLLVLQTLAVSLLIFPLPVKANGNDFFADSAFDNTSEGHDLTSTELNKLNTSDNDRYESDGFWPKNTEDFDDEEYLEFLFSPNIPENANISSVELTHEYLNTTSNTLTETKYEIWNSDEESFFDVFVDPPSSGNTEITDHLDLLEEVDISTPEQLNNLKVRFLAFVSTNNNIRTRHDLVKLEVQIEEEENQPPTAPELLLPANEANINDSTPAFDWEDSEDPDGEIDFYNLKVATSSTLENPIIDQDINPDSEFTAEEPLADGQYFWRVTAVDDEGAEASSVIFSFNLDTNDISSTIIFPADGAFYNALSWQSILGTASDSNSGVALVEVQIQRAGDGFFWKTGNTWQAEEVWNEALGTTSWTYDLAVENLTDGESYTVKSRATDHAGNIESTAEATFTYDNTPPQNVSLLINDGNALTNDRLVTLSLSGADNTGITQIQISEDGINFGPVQTFQNTINFVLSTAGDGVKTVFVNFQDAAVNIAQASDSIELDTTPPADAQVTQSPVNQEIEEGTTITIEGTAEPGSEVEVTLESHPKTIKTVADLSGFWRVTFDTTGLEEGEHSIKIKVTDLAGNEFSLVLGKFKIKLKTVAAPVVETPPFASLPDAIGGPVITPVLAAPPAEEPKEEVAPTPIPSEVKAAPAEEGKIKPAEEKRPTNTFRILITIAILIIAAGAALGGYFGYEWWLKKENRPPTNSRW